MSEAAYPSEPCLNCGTMSWPFGRICPGCREVRWRRWMRCHLPGGGSESVPIDGLLRLDPQALEYFFDDQLDDFATPFPEWGFLNLMYQDPGSPDPEKRRTVFARRHNGSLAFLFNRSDVEIEEFFYVHAFTGLRVTYADFPRPCCESLPATVERAEPTAESGVLPALSDHLHGKPSLKRLCEYLWRRAAAGKPACSYREAVEALYDESKGGTRRWETIVSNAKRLKAELEAYPEHRPYCDEIRRIRIVYKDADQTIALFRTAFLSERGGRLD